MNTIKVNKVSHHRNGVSGASFHVVLFESEGGNNLVGVVFYKPNHCAVFDPKEAAEGNIAFGSNSFQGDHFEVQLRKAIEEYELWRAVERVV